MMVGSGWHVSDYLEQMLFHHGRILVWLQHKPQHVNFCKWDLDPKKRQQTVPFVDVDGG